MRRLHRHDAESLAARLGRPKEEFAGELALSRPRDGDAVRLPGGQSIVFTSAEVQAIVDAKRYDRPRHPE